MCKTESSTDEGVHESTLRSRANFEVGGKFAQNFKVVPESLWRAGTTGEEIDTYVVTLCI